MTLKTIFAKLFLSVVCTIFLFMLTHIAKIKVLVLPLVLLLISFVIANSLYQQWKSTRIINILGITICPVSPCSEPPQSVTVTSYVRTQEINFKVYPEKRIPAVGNWDTTTDVILQNCTNSSTLTFNGIVTNNLGEGTIILPVNPPVLNDQYRFIINGLSHLKRRYNCYLIDTIAANIDLTLENKELLAGEISNVFDNYINSLDLSVMGRNFFGLDVKTDLNQDGLVNSLDLSNQIYNFYLAGE